VTAFFYSQHFEFAAAAMVLVQDFKF